VKFAIYLPTIREFADAALLGELAARTEESGWDGCFIWDVMAPSARYGGPAVDPWIALAVMGTRTTSIRLGTMVTPVSRRRPLKLARETASVDRLAGGRLVLGVGLGDDLDQLGEEPDPLVRAALLDEGLDLLGKAWSGQPLSHAGAHYSLEGPPFLPTPMQSPRIPVWVGGRWPNRRPLRRAARWDGYFPVPVDLDDPLTPSDFLTIGRELAQLRTSATPFDVVFCTTLDGQRPSLAEAGAYEAAGVTWWLQAVASVDEARTRIGAGSPGSS
jgi:alkanesulfonate monooxygenase SsuD/methylene tetrahydromethanopterin reductase-like flavin-dependent oxidoreductase (luciferase family)